MTARTENGICSEESANGQTHILDLTGGNGPWQWRVFLVFFFLSIPAADHNFIITFLAPEQDYWCSGPTGDLNISRDEWMEFGLPAGDKKCSRYENTFFTISLNESENDTVVACDSWEYDRSFYTSTLLSEWNLVCSRSWLVSISKSIFIAGILVSVVFCGNVSDRVGRRPTITAACIVMVIASIICAFSSSFWMFLITRFFLAMGVGGYYNTLAVLMMEMVSPELRSVYGNVVHLGWSVGFLCLPAVVWFVRDWFWIQIAVSAPGFVFVFVWWMIPESPSWLLSTGRIKEARETLVKASKMNKIDVPNIDTAIGKIIEVSSKGSGSMTSGGKYFEFLRHPGLWQMTLAVYFTRFVIGFTYYGLSLNTNELAGNPLVNFALSGIIEFPGCLFAVLSVRYFGRKKTLFLTFITGGLVCLASYFVPKDITWLSVAVSMLGKLCICCSYGVMYVYTQELFPTVVRNTASGGAYFFEQIGSIIAPFVRELGVFTEPYVPFVIFGALGVTSGIAVLLLPETGDCHLSDSIEDFIKATRKENKNLQNENVEEVTER